MCDLYEDTHIQSTAAFMGSVVPFTCHWRLAVETWPTEQAKNKARRMPPLSSVRRQRAHEHTQRLPPGGSGDQRLGLKHSLLLTIADSPLARKTKEQKEKEINHRRRGHSWRQTLHNVASRGDEDRHVRQPSTVSSDVRWSWAWKG